VHGLDGLLHAAEGRHDDDACILREGALSQESEDLAVGKVEVHKGELEPEVLQLATRLVQAAGLGHLGAELPEKGSEALAERDVVLEQQYLASWRKCAA
jgi:hypothetical protein